MAVISQSIPPRVQRPAARRDGSASERGAGLLVILCIVTALMSILYLAQTGRVATQGYLLQQLDERKTTLIRQNQQLSFEIERAQSLDTIRERAEALGLRPVKPAQARALIIQVTPARYTAAAR